MADKADPVAQQAYDLDQMLQLYYPGSYSYNWAGLQEKWIRSAAAGVSWYCLTPGGKLYKWLGGAPTNSQWVADLSAVYYQSPELLYNAQQPAVTEVGEGIATAVYAVNGISQGSVPGFTVGQENQTLTVTLPSGDGAKEVTVTLTSGTGEQFVLTKTITLDATKPVALFSINGDAARTESRDVELDLSQLSDGTSGIELVRVSVDGTTWTDRKSVV